MSRVLFVDESGDLGGKVKNLVKGQNASSRYFVLTGVYVPKCFVDEIRRAVKDTLQDLRREKPSLQELKGEYLKRGELTVALKTLALRVKFVDIYFVYISKNSVDFARFVDANQHEVYSIMLVSLIDQFDLKPSLIVIDPSQYAEFAKNTVLKYYHYDLNRVVIDKSSMHEPVLQFADLLSNAFFKAKEFRDSTALDAVKSYWSVQERFLYDKLVKREFHRMLSLGIFSKKQ